MNPNNALLLFFLLMVILNMDDAEPSDRVLAITDNGQASHQELSPTKTNVDVYNYAALSTSY